MPISWYAFWLQSDEVELMWSSKCVDFNRLRWRQEGSPQRYLLWMAIESSMVSLAIGRYWILSERQLRACLEFRQISARYETFVTINLLKMLAGYFRGNRMVCTDKQLSAPQNTNWSENRKRRKKYSYNTGRNRSFHYDYSVWSPPIFFMTCHSVSSGCDAWCWCQVQCPELSWLLSL